MLCPTLLAIKETQSKTTVCYQYMLIRMANRKSRANAKFWKEAEKHMHCRWDIKYDIAALEDGLAFS